MYEHSWARPWRLLLPRPLFSWLLWPRPEVNLAPDTLLPDLDLPVLILHAAEDAVVRIELARRLFSARSRDTSVQFVELLGHFGHSDLYQAPELPGLIQRMNENC